MNSRNSSSDSAPTAHLLGPTDHRNRPWGCTFSYFPERAGGARALTHSRPPPASVATVGPASAPAAPVAVGRPVRGGAAQGGAGPPGPARRVAGPGGGSAGGGPVAGAQQAP